MDVLQQIETVAFALPLETHLLDYPHTIVEVLLVAVDQLEMPDVACSSSATLVADEK